MNKRFVLTGYSGAGLKTALALFEDCGFQRIENLPLPLLPLVLAEENVEKLTISYSGLTRNQAKELVSTIKLSKASSPLIFFTANQSVLFRRYSETRRAHPYGMNGALRDSIEKEVEALQILRDAADYIIDTSEFAPQQLKSELKRIFDLVDDQSFSIQFQSFSYKRGLPRDSDFVFDCRFLNNPHWVEGLRERTGLSEDVQSYVMSDPNFSNYFQDVTKMLAYTIPAAKREGRSYVTVSFGCSGGKHRSVTLAECVNKKFAEQGLNTKIRHREIEVKE